MTDLFQLPDGKLVRMGQAFTIMLPRQVVVPALVGHDEATGNEYIAEQAKVMDTEVEQAIPANWLSIASPEMLEAFGITPIEEQPDKDPQYWMTSPGEVKNGVLWKVYEPRPMEQIRGWLNGSSDNQAQALIDQHYPLAQQLEDTAYVQDLAFEPEQADPVRVQQIKNRRAWLREIRAYRESLKSDIAILEDVEDAKAWAEAPADWPAWPELEIDRTKQVIVRPTVEAIKP